VLEYSGFFEGGWKNGQGSLFTADSKYEGNFVKDLKDGYGEEFGLKNGITYKGLWKND
jgi:hypothetical protein